MGTIWNLSNSAKPSINSNFNLQRAEYQDQLARKRQEEELAAKARLQEDQLRKQEESVKRQEDLRKGMYFYFFAKIF